MFIVRGNTFAQKAIMDIIFSSKIKLEDKKIEILTIYTHGYTSNNNI